MNICIEDDLKQNGLRNTKCRAVLLDVLDQTDQPITADRLLYELSQRKITVSLSTVYRELDTLVKKDLVNKLSITGENKTLFEYNRMVHRHYLICLGCREIRALRRCPLQGYEETLIKETDYTISGHKLDVFGYCPACQKSRRNITLA